MWLRGTVMERGIDVESQTMFENNVYLVFGERYSASSGNWDGFLWGHRARTCRDLEE